MMPATATRTTAVTIAVGGIPIRLNTDDREYAHVLRERFGRFVHDASEPLFEFDLTLVDPDRVQPDDDFRVTTHDGLWRIERADCDATFNVASGHGTIRQPAHGYATDSILRIVHSVLLAPRGGMLLHASSAVRNGRTFIFFGPSGAGKTTMVGMAPADAQVLSDEVSYVRRDADGYVGCGTPFTGELARIGEDVEAPIGGIFRLVQASEHRIVPMSAGDAARALLECVLCFAVDPGTVRAVFDAVCDLVTRVPVQTLEFRREPSAWELIA